MRNWPRCIIDEKLLARSDRIAAVTTTGHGKSLAGQGRPAPRQHGSGNDDLTTRTKAGRRRDHRPYLSERTRDVIAGRGVSYIDSTGNMRLRSDRPALYILTNGADKDPWPDDQPLKSLRGRGAGRTPATLASVIDLLALDALLTRDARRSRKRPTTRGARPKSSPRCPPVRPSRHHVPSDYHHVHSGPIRTQLVGVRWPQMLGAWCSCTSQLLSSIIRPPCPYST